MLTPLGDDGNYHRIVQIAVGQQHGLLLTDEGVVYSWGGKNEGQLGRTPSNQEMCQKPCPVGDALRDKIIVQIACGLRHCLALTQDGKLYSWGHNKAGQLGLPKSALHMSRDWIIHPSRVGGDSEDMNVKSCSCGPESSACVTTNGEVYVWGAISHYMHDKAKHHNHVWFPTKLRSVEKATPVEGGPCVWTAGDVQPHHVALYKDMVVTTLTKPDVQAGLMEYDSMLKKRSHELIDFLRRFQNKKNAPSRDSDQRHWSAFKGINTKVQQECRQRIGDISIELRTIDVEIKRITREIIACEQIGASVVVQGGESSKRDDKAAAGRITDTQLHDLFNFRGFNKKNKMRFLEQRDMLEQQKWTLEQELQAKMRTKQMAAARIQLLDRLARNSQQKKATSLSDSLKVALRKQRQLADTFPEVLSSAGNFGGLREVMAISDMALQDVSSSLKEVSSAVASNEGVVFEEILEVNLKRRKEINTLISEKLVRAEWGGDGHAGLHQFFEETSEHHADTKRSHKGGTFSMLSEFRR